MVDRWSLRPFLRSDCRLMGTLARNGPLYEIVWTKQTKTEFFYYETSPKLMDHCRGKLHNERKFYLSIMVGAARNARQTKGNIISNADKWCQ